MIYKQQRQRVNLPQIIYVIVEELFNDKTQIQIFYNIGRKWIYYMLMKVKIWCNEKGSTVCKTFLGKKRWEKFAFLSQYFDWEDKAETKILATPSHLSFQPHQFYPPLNVVVKVKLLNKNIFWKKETIHKTKLKCFWKEKEKRTI